MVLFKWFFDIFQYFDYKFLHSNMVLFKFAVRSNIYNVAKAFTFQYGSIQMELDQFISELEEIFTFQYGSIQMAY